MSKLCNHEAAGQSGTQARLSVEEVRERCIEAETCICDGCTNMEDCRLISSYERVLDAIANHPERCEHTGWFRECIQWARELAAAARGRR